MTEAQVGPQVRFRPRRLAHANLAVGDNRTAVGFYRDICGFHEVYEAGELNATFLSNGSSHHDLLLVQIPGKPPGLNHLAFEMETEQQLVDACRRAVEAGVEIERSTDHDVTHSVYLRDPDGSQIEFYADVQEDWRAWYASIEELRSEEWDPFSGEPMDEPRYSPQPDFRPRGDALLPALVLDRAVLAVSDLDASLAFYDQVAGLNELEVDREQRFAYLAGTLGRTEFALLETGGIEELQPGLAKLAFRLADASSLRVSDEELEAAGVEVVTRLEGERPALLLRDPDGRLIELGKGLDRPAAVSGADRATLLHHL